jgi:hypothetical protein
LHNCRLEKLHSDSLLAFELSKLAEAVDDPTISVVVEGGGDIVEDIADELNEDTKGAAKEVAAKEVEDITIDALE